MERMTVYATIRVAIPMELDGEYDHYKEGCGKNGTEDVVEFHPYDADAENKLKDLLDHRFSDCKDIEFEINDID